MAHRKVKKSESEFDKLARLIKGEGDDIRGELIRLEKRMEGLEKKTDEGFSSVQKELAVINRRLDTIIQMQLDEHARRIKKLETAVFSR